MPNNIIVFLYYKYIYTLYNVLQSCQRIAGSIRSQQYRIVSIHLEEQKSIIYISNAHVIELATGKIWKFLRLGHTFNS